MKHVYKSILVPEVPHIAPKVPQIATKVPQIAPKFQWKCSKVYQKSSKLSKLPFKVPQIFPKCHKLHQTCLQIIQKLLQIILKVPQIAPIVLSIVSNEPKTAENDPIVKGYPTENNLAYQRSSWHEGQHYAWRSSQYDWFNQFCFVVSFNSFVQIIPCGHL